MGSPVLCTTCHLRPPRCAARLLAGCSLLSPSVTPPPLSCAACRVVCVVCRAGRAKSNNNRGGTRTKACRLTYVLNRDFRHALTVTVVGTSQQGVQGFLEQLPQILLADGRGPKPPSPLLCCAAGACLPRCCAPSCGPPRPAVLCPPPAVLFGRALSLP